MMRATTRRSRTWGPLAMAVLASALVAGGCGSAQTPEPGQTTPSPVSTSPAPSSTTGMSPTRSISPTRSTTNTTTSTAAPTSTSPARTTTTTSRTTTTTPPKTTTPPTCSLGSLVGKDVERIPTTKKVVALTFDGGGSNAGGRKILDTLSAKGAPATFFFTGDFTLDYPSLAREIARTYPVGNHTQNHPDLTTLTRTQVVDEIRKGRATILAQTGAETRPLFRFPFGARSTETISLVNQECYVAYRWTTDTLGWKGTSGGLTADAVYQRVMNDLQPGQIVLMHIGANPTDGTTLDADALPRMIDGIRARGYTLVTLPR
jgi:peptidoglycan/xylan/chitin deacetylase (PgdA/CDA1 family)